MFMGRSNLLDQDRSTGSVVTLLPLDLFAQCFEFEPAVLRRGKLRLPL
jgi:hypothetical protein